MAKKIYKYTLYPPFYINLYGWGSDSLKALGTAFNQENLGSSIAGIGGALTSMVGAGVNNALIGDTSSIENDIQNTQNLRFSGSTNDALMQSWQLYNPLDNVSYKDVRGGSNSQRVMSTLGAGISGAANGAKVGGPWGAAIGGVVGLGSGIWGLLAGNKKANLKTAKLNARIAQANLQAVNNFSNSVQNVDTNTDLNLLANYAAYGGKMNKLSSGGKLNDGMTGMMKARMALANEFGNKAAQRMVSPNPNTYTFTGEEKNFKGEQASSKGNTGTHYLGSFGNYAVPSIQEINNKMVFIDGVPKANPKEDIRFDRPEDAEYFAEHYKEIAPMMRNNNFANGGHTHGSEWDNGITVFDNGDTHELNPNGGVQIGVDPQGVPNMVEQGEVRYGDYILSNRITMPKEFRKQYKLKKNSTFADAAKKLSKESEERPNDPISKAGLDAGMTKLTHLLEFIKAEQQPLQEIQSLLNMFDKGGIRIPKFVPGPMMEMPYASKSNDYSLTDINNITGVKTNTTPVGVTEDYWNNEYNSTLKNKMLSKKGFDTSLLRYAPALGAGIGVFSDLMGWTNKPDYSNADMIALSTRNLSNVEFNPLGNYMAYKPLDRNYYLNQLLGNAGATRRDIINQSGGNRATAMAGLLASDYNTTGSIGKLAREAEEYNLTLKQKVEDFNRATNMFNSEGSMKAQMANKTNEELRLKSAMTLAEMRDRADMMSSQARTANLTNLFDSIGDIGREEFAKNQIGWEVSKGIYGNFSYDDIMSLKQPKQLKYEMLKKQGYTDDELKAKGFFANGGKLNNRKKGLTF